MNLTRTKQATETVSVSLVPLDTCHDFLGGAFGRAERTRRGYLASAGVAFLGLAAVTFTWFTAHSSATDDRAAAEAATASNLEVTAQLAQIDQADGIPADVLRVHAADRQKAYLTAIAGETNYASLYAELLAATPAGVTISSIDIVDPAAGTSTAPGSTGTASGESSLTEDTTTEASATEAATTADGSAEPAAPSPKTLTISGSVTSFGGIGVWAKAVEQVRGVGVVNPTWSGGGDSLVVTLTTTVGPEAESPRARAAATSDEYGIVTGGTVG